MDMKNLPSNQQLCKELDICSTVPLIKIFKKIKQKCILFNIDTRHLLVCCVAKRKILVLFNIKIGDSSFLLLKILPFGVSQGFIQDLFLFTIYKSYLLSLYFQIQSHRPPIC